MNEGAAIWTLSPHYIIASDFVVRLTTFKTPDPPGAKKYWCKVAAQRLSSLRASGEEISQRPTPFHWKSSSPAPSSVLCPQSALFNQAHTIHRRGTILLRGHSSVPPLPRFLSPLLGLNNKRKNPAPLLVGRWKLIDWSPANKHSINDDNFFPCPTELCQALIKHAHVSLRWTWGKQSREATWSLALFLENLKRLLI